MQQQYRKTLKVVVDLFVLSLAWYCAFAVRWDLPENWSVFKQMALLLPYVVLLKFFLLILFDVHLFVWRYVGLREGVRILYALAICSTILAGCRLIGPIYALTHPLSVYAIVPLGVIFVDFTFAAIGLIGARMLWRMITVQRGRGGELDFEVTPTILIGAGSGGVEIAKEIEKNPRMGIRPVGFLDDNPNLIGHVIQGLKVLGPTLQLEQLARKFGFKQALITMSQMPRQEVRRIMEECKKAEVIVKIVPGLSEIVGGHVSLNSIRKVAIEDLLGREPVQLDTDAISAQLRDRTVLVTGAGGSIGSELCRQIAGFSPRVLLLVEQTENNLFNIHRELSAAYPKLNIIPLVADVTDLVRLRAIFSKHNPEIVFHAAAHKHVPMMEWNPGEAIKNNVFGTKNVADLSHAHGVSHFVMISTDKAVNPSSVMGTSKRIAEIYVQAYSQISKTHFVTVRFGNVLGSSGSVVPIFHEQIARGGPVTVTHPDVKRYFMTIPEASQLVLQAGAMGKGGEIFVLDMGEPVNIANLAKDMIRLSGLNEGSDIEIKFTGLRPGEKLFEELSFSEENVVKTRHSKIFIGRIRPQQWETISKQLDMLKAFADEGSNENIRGMLIKVVPEYVPVLACEKSDLKTLQIETETTSAQVK